MEGLTDDEKVNEFRWRQRANMLATMFLSLGVPMLCGGDELGKTQYGNNNAYCQDNNINYYQWKETMQDKSKVQFLDFIKNLITIRLNGKSDS